MDIAGLQQAAALLLKSWRAGQTIDILPKECRPKNLNEGYAIQSQLAAISSVPVVGWKIAATSVGGQKHIGVNGPLSGRLFADRVHSSRVRIDLRDNHMRVAEAEFAFRMSKDLPPRRELYEVGEVMAAVECMHPAIELPDSRFADFAHAGGPQLVADDACACQFVLGERSTQDWRNTELAQQTVRLRINGQLVTEGHGADALGDPRKALTWIANNHTLQGTGLQAGQIVTTGVCGIPCAVAPGDHVAAEIGRLGMVEVHLV